MSLTVKHINSDASFLLTFSPTLPFPPSPNNPARSFTILLDPWITGASKIWHHKFSISRHKHEACISSLTELDEPDLVIISQDKTDHCHEETLKQLPRSGGKTVILAEPAASKVIKGWKFFDKEKVATLPRWEATRNSSAIYRVPVPPVVPGGIPGEVTIAFIEQKKDITRLHSAIGITYRPPPSSMPYESPPLTPPGSPHSPLSTFSNFMDNRTLSVIFSPHGCNYKTLSPYVTSHLITEAALPLTCLLHCFDRVQNAWYMGGNISAGFPGGLEIAQSLCAKVWISAHDGDKDTTGFANNKIKIQKFPREEVENVVSPRSDKFPGRKMGTEAVVLKAGEEITLNRIMQFGPCESDDGHLSESLAKMGSVY
jgi:hypothetical protein